MVAYLEGHGGQTGTKVFVPDNLTLHYYADAGKDARASVTLLVEALADDSVAPVESVTEALCDNNSFSELAPNELSYSLSIADPSLNIKYVGTDNLPAGILLCSRRGQGDCTADRIRDLGRHTCTGVLGVLHDAGAIHMMTCRGSGQKDAMQSYPPNKETFFADLDVEVKKMLQLIKDDPDTAYARINAMYGTPDRPPAEAAEYWKTLNTANRAELIETQRRLILMLNETSGIQDFLYTYGERKYLDENGPIALYAYYLASDSKAKARMDREFRSALDTVQEYVAKMHEWLQDPANEWSTISAGNQEQLLIIDSYTPDQPLRRLITGNQVDTPAIDWATVYQEIANCLKNQSAGQYVEFIAVKGRQGEFLFTDTHEEALANDAEMGLYTRWQIRPYVHIKDTDDTLDCGVTVRSVDGSNVAIELIDPGDGCPDAVAAAVLLLNDTGAITVSVQ